LEREGWPAAAGSWREWVEAGWGVQKGNCRLEPTVAAGVMLAGRNRN
jgi:hypothetical protein